MTDKSDLTDLLRKTTNERDSAREDLKEMSISRMILLKEKAELAS